MECKVELVGNEQVCHGVECKVELVGGMNRYATVWNVKLSWWGE